jgi:geranylgeranyl pyrophosphate synthase
LAGNALQVLARVLADNPVVFAQLGEVPGGVTYNDRLRALMRYADQLALAFQIMDDVRDVEGGASLGKEAGGDLDRRVPT